MHSLKATQMHDRPFRATKESIQPSAAKDPFFALLQKDLLTSYLSSMMAGLRSRFLLRPRSGNLTFWELIRDISELETVNFTSY